MSGFVVKMISKQLNDVCLKGCLDEFGEKEKEALGLFELKQRGPLLKPSKYVITIYATTENAITIMLNSTNVHSRIIDGVVQNLSSSSSLFVHITKHQLATKSSICVSQDHIFTLINTIINCYIKIKFYHCIRTLNNEMKSGIFL